MSFIYLDYNATTPIDPRVAEAMAPFLTGGYGNPSSVHVEGRRAKAAFEEARERVARCLGCRPRSGVHLGGVGVEQPGDPRPGRSTGWRPCHHLCGRTSCGARGGPRVEIEGRIELTVVGVDKFGRVDPEAVSAALRDDTVLVSLMLANNEVGTLQPVRDVAVLCRERGVAIHTDAAQAVGKVPVDVTELGVDLLSVAGHKLYAAKGVGALYVREGVEILPQIRGAGHERGRRAGTENVLLAVGLGLACKLARDDVAEERVRLADLRERLTTGLRAGCGDLVEHGHPDERLPNTLSVALPGRDAESAQWAIWPRSWPSRPVRRATPARP